MSVVVTSFRNDESAHPPTLLKAVSTADILIDEVQQSQNSYFKEHLKSILFNSMSWNMIMIASFKKQFNWSSPKHWMHQSPFPVSSILSS